MRRIFSTLVCLALFACAGCQKMSHTYTNEGPAQEPGKDIVSPNAHDRPVWSEGPQSNKTPPQ